MESSGGVKKETAKPPISRLRSGDFRAYYRILSDDVSVLAVTHKKDTEKFLKELR
ncbi:MAG: hypothetical protein HZC48_00085 [Nitrospirae bacterium]|nr:hypothetical protein [Nitrospirota bacterium]